MPLSMSSTYFSLADALNSGKPFARGQYWHNDTRTFREVEYVDNSALEGAGAVLSTVSDYAKWVHMMIQRSGPLSKAGHEALVKPHILIGTRGESGSMVTYGYGWIVEQYQGHELVWHNGGENGVSLSTCSLSPSTLKRCWMIV